MADLATLDLGSGQSEAELASTLEAACGQHGPGFFYAVGHGVTDDLRSRMYAASKALFDLPPEAKRDVQMAGDGRGWTPLGEETLDPEHQSRGDTKEGYYIGREPLAADEAGQPLRAPNKWPDETRHPSVAGFRATSLEYHAALTAVGMRLLRLVALALGLPADGLDAHFTRPLAVLRLLKYSPEASVPAEGVMGCGAHADYGCLTLLSTDEHPGLQIKTQGEWLAVPPRPDALIVNVGDMLQRWSNGRFRSTVHRVVIGPGGGTRYSVPFFFEPNFDCSVAPLPQCVPAGEAPKYAPCTMGEFVLAKYAGTHELYRDGEGDAAECAEAS